MHLQMKNNALVSSGEEEKKYFKLISILQQHVTQKHPLYSWKSTVLLSMEKVDPTRTNEQIQKDVLPT